MAGKLLSTFEVPEYERFDYWRELICDVFVRLDCTSPSRRSFSGSIYNQVFSKMQISSMRADRMRVERSRRQIAKSCEDYFLIAIQGYGSSVGSQDGRQVHLNPGDLALFDSTRPYQVYFEPGFRHDVLRIPRRVFHRRVGGLDTLTSTLISGRHGAGKLASRFLRALPKELGSLHENTAMQLSNTCLDILSLALGDLSARAKVQQTTTLSMWLIKIKNFIEEELHDPELSPSTIANAFGISTRYLNIIFENEKNSTGKYIWERRMEKCYLDLAADAHAGRSISDIAFGWGYNDMSHFSRSFRARYGMSPRDFRKHRHPSSASS